MKQSKKNQDSEMTMTMEGLMTIGENNNGLKMLDFMCAEYVEIAPFTANCKVQAMHNGDVYVSELKKRVRNSPLFREANSSLTIGRDGRVYFYFMLPQKQMNELPDKLVMQALSIAQKVEQLMAGKKGGKK